MTFLHIDVLRCSTVTHDEREAEGFVLHLELFGLVIELTFAVRR